MQIIEFFPTPHYGRLLLPKATASATVPQCSRDASEEAILNGASVTLLSDPAFFGGLLGTVSPNVINSHVVRLCPSWKGPINHELVHINIVISRNLLTVNWALFSFVITYPSRTVDGLLTCGFSVPEPKRHVLQGQCRTVPAPKPS
ncbi:hypothetical protein CHU98_g492 [Xylaria longipes]|nr:hypothetical protein CHU98_g492 [Xylaria longipes]